MMLGVRREAKHSRRLEVCQTSRRLDDYAVSHLLRPHGSGQELPIAVGRALWNRRGRVLESVWVVTRFNTTPIGLANYLLGFMDANDRIFVTEAPDNYAYRNTLAKAA